MATIVPMTNPSSLTALLFRRLRWVLAIQVATLFVASVGFVVFAEYGWFDAFYMSVITLGTIGYGEVNPLDTTGRLWAIVVITGGFAVLVYSGAVLTSLLLSGELTDALVRQRRARMRDRLKDHVVVVGFGRVGQAVVRAALRAGHECVVVDHDESKRDEITRAGAIAVVGDGMQETVLHEAAIGTARGLVAAAPDDPVNLVVTLTGRAVRPDLRIVSRVNDPAWEERITRAGASAAASPYADFGAGLAASALGTDVVETHSLSGYGLRTEDVIIGRGSKLIGRRPHELADEYANATFIAMRRSSQASLPASLPASSGTSFASGTPWEKTDDALREGDLLVIVGPDHVVAHVIHGTDG